MRQGQVAQDLIEVHVHGALNRLSALGGLGERLFGGWPLLGVESAHVFVPKKTSVCWSNLLQRVANMVCWSLFFPTCTPPVTTALQPWRPCISQLSASRMRKTHNENTKITLVICRQSQAYFAMLLSRRGNPVPDVSEIDWVNAPLPPKLVSLGGPAKCPSEAFSTRRLLGTILPGGEPRHPA